MGEVDPAADFLAREQSVLADLDDNFKDQKGKYLYDFRYAFKNVLLLIKLVILSAKIQISL